jgi:hypothetical protein
VKDHLTTRPLTLRLSQGTALRTGLRGLLLEAAERQRDGGGALIVEILMRHLVGAKLEVLFPEIEIEHHGSAMAPYGSRRKGTFFLNGSVVHVSSRPTERLIQLCTVNLEEGLMPVIVTSKKGVISVDSLLENSPQLIGRVETLELEQFLVTNITEWAEFAPSERKACLQKLLDAYNELIDRCETDPSLRIELK